MIGAVLKTVERSRVPWVRIPPPPPFKKPEPQRFRAFNIIYHVHCVNTIYFEQVLSAVVIVFEQTFQSCTVKMIIG